MALTDKDVEHVARLARLALTDDEKKTVRRELGRVLDFMRNLEACDTSAAPPTLHAAPPSFVPLAGQRATPSSANPWREDEPRPFTETDLLLANAPEREDRFFKVKKVIE
jgi:aspartyl-tRNA(Asn)/glutamyl-tRNA(Gln) amidotransferase subunit C